MWKVFCNHWINFYFHPQIQIVFTSQQPFPSIRRKIELLYIPPGVDHLVFETRAEVLIQ